MMSRGAGIILYAGYGRGDYPLFRLADVSGNTIGVMADFFVDNGLGSCSSNDRNWAVCVGGILPTGRQVTSSRT